MTALGIILNYLGNNEFAPIGADAVRIRFSGALTECTILDGRRACCFRLVNLTFCVCMKISAVTLLQSVLNKESRL